MYRATFQIFGCESFSLRQVNDWCTGTTPIVLALSYFHVMIFSFAFGFCSLGEVEKIMTHSSSFHGAKNVKNYF